MEEDVFEPEFVLTVGGADGCDVDAGDETGSRRGCECHFSVIVAVSSEGDELGFFEGFVGVFEGVNFGVPDEAEETVGLGLVGVSGWYEVEAASLGVGNVGFEQFAVEAEVSALEPFAEAKGVLVFLGENDEFLGGPACFGAACPDELAVVPSDLDDAEVEGFEDGFGSGAVGEDDLEVASPAGDGDGGHAGFEAEAAAGQGGE